MRSTRCLVLGVASLALACDQGTTAPAGDADGDVLTEALATVSADAAIEDLAGMSEMLPGPAAVGPADGMGARRNLIRERTVTYFDESGAEQPGYDPALTASIHSVFTLEGEIERPGMEATLSRSRDLWVTGLLGDEVTRTFNGTGEEAHSRTRVRDDQGLRTFEMEATAVITDVVRAVDREAQPWPLSGTITRSWRVVIGTSQNGEVVRERTATITFDGTQYALLVIDGEEFEVDLAAGPSDRAHHRRGQRP